MTLLRISLLSLFLVLSSQIGAKVDENHFDYMDLFDLQSGSIHIKTDRSSYSITYKMIQT